MTVVKTHDFTRTETLDRQYVPALNAAFDALARHGTVELSASLRRSTQLGFSSLREMPWSQVAALLGERPYLATFNLEPLSGTAVFLLSLQTVVRMLDYRLGGGTQPAFAGHNDLTETDFAVLSGVVTPLLTELATSLSRFREVTAVPAVQESSVQLVQVAGPDEMFLVTSFELCVGDDDPAEMVFALPFPLVRQITEAVRAGSRGRDDASLLVDESVVTQASLEVWLELPSVRVSSADVSELGVGDVIRFFHPLSQPLDLRAEGVLVARAVQGSVGSKVVSSVLEEVSDDDL